MLVMAGLPAINAQGFGYSFSERSLTTLTAQGVGPIVLGADVDKLPWKLEGLYDRRLYINPPKEIKENWFRGWEFYDTDGNVVLQAVLDGQGKISTVIVHGKNISTSGGIRVGLSKDYVKGMKGVQQVTSASIAGNYPQSAFQVGGVNLWCDAGTVSEMFVGQNPVASTRTKMYPDIPRDVIAAAPAPPPSTTKPVAQSTSKQQPVAPPSKQGGTVMTARGIPPVVFGANPANLPASCKGVYARKSKEELWDCGDFMGYYWQFYDEKGREIFQAEVDDKNKICGITVTTSAIPMENGMRVGMTRKQVEAYKGVKKYVPGKWADESYARISYEYGKYTLYVDWENSNIIAEIEFGE